MGDLTLYTRTLYPVLTVIAQEVSRSFDRGFQPSPFRCSGSLATPFYIRQSGRFRGGLNWRERERGRERERERERDKEGRHITRVCLKLARGCVTRPARERPKSPGSTPRTRSVPSIHPLTCPRHATTKTSTSSRS